MLSLLLNESIHIDFNMSSIPSNCAFIFSRNNGSSEDERIEDASSAHAFLIRSIPDQSRSSLRTAMSARLFSASSEDLTGETTTIEESDSALSAPITYISLSISLLPTKDEPGRA